MKRAIPFLLLLTACSKPAVAGVLPSTTTSTTSTTTTTTTTTTLVEVAPPPTTVPDTECAEWYGAAMAAGWTPDLWPQVARVMYRESRCNPDAYNGDDPNGGSHSLMQVNGIWLDWFLQSKSIAWTTAHLYDPITNLKAARAIYERQGNTWKAWGL